MKKWMVSMLFTLLAVFSLGQTTFAGETPAVSQSRLELIQKRGYILIGTTGDYKPFSYYDAEANTYTGYDIDAALLLARDLGVEARFVKTTWPTLLRDLLADQFDIAMGGITRTFEREKKAHLSHGYIPFGKAALIRGVDQEKYVSLASIDQSGVKIGVNPGGTNEKFVRANIKNAEIIVVTNNLAIPKMVANAQVDVMITDSIEALRYAKEDASLFAACTEQPFTSNQFGYLMKHGEQDFANFVDMWMEEMVLKKEFDGLRKKWID
ncbi:transporter substrate-binding domain-containing protein [Azotosporobacter soli]|uniref:transporter substrate-binding domain-containing protein n=1 Tax=Azotosporobacter soli TaxID=3055040 RepID=UPI0031FEC25B